MKSIEALSLLALVALSNVACDKSGSDSTEGSASAVASAQAAETGTARTQASSDGPTCATLAAKLVKLQGHDENPKEAEFATAMMTKGCESAGNLGTVDRSMVDCLMKATDKKAAEACDDAKATEMMKAWEKALKDAVQKELEGDQSKVGSCNVIQSAGSCREYRGSALEMGDPKSLCDGEFKLEACPSENRTSSCKTTAEGTDFYYSVPAAGTLESQEKFCKDVRSGEFSKL